MRTRPRRPRVEWLEARQLLAVLTVNSTADAAAPTTVLTLREAIQVVDGTTSVSSLSTQQQAQISGALSTPNTINFNIPGAGVHTIEPTTSLPTVTTPVVINGYSQPGSSQNTLTVGDNAKILIELDGELVGDGNGLSLSGGHSVVEGLDINRFGVAYTGQARNGGEGLAFNFSPGGDLAWGNFIGTDPTGMIGEPNSNYGFVSGHETSPDTLGGTQPGARNIIQVGDVGTFQQFGVEIDHENGAYVLGNYIGTNATGTAVPSGQGTANANGLTIGDSNEGDHIGGTAPGAGNVIEGIYIGNFDHTTEYGYNVIQGNMIGVDVTGKRSLLGQNVVGVTVVDSVSNVIGGTAPGDGNVIGADGNSAIYLTTANPATVEGTVIEGNHIGTDLSGALNFGDYNGVAAFSSGNVIGDILPGAGNVIANDTTDGVEYPVAGTTGNRVLGNTIYNSLNGGIVADTAATLTSPSFTAAYPVATGLLVQGGTFAGGTPKTTYVVEFDSNPGFDGDGQAEGRTVLGHIGVVTDANGNGAFGALLPVAVAPGRVVTATVTGPGGNTTSFSLGVIVSAQPGDSMTLSPSATSSKFGQSVWFTSVVIPAVAGLGAPTGSIVFRDGSTVLGSVNLDGAGTATFYTSTLAKGTHRISAVYAGDGVYTGVVSSTVTLVVS